MSDNNSSSSTADKTIVDKAKEAAADIDVKEIVDKAKVVAVDIKDKSVDAAETVKEKVTHFVGDHEDQIGGYIDKTGHFVDEKLTRQKFSDKIDKAQEVAKGAVHKVGQTADDADETSGEQG